MDAWERIELWLKNNCPEAFADLAKPATDAKLADLEAKLAIKLPADAVNTYRKHDGQMGMGPPIAGAWKFLPLKSVAVQWNIQRKLLEEGAFATATAKAKGPVRPIWWSAQWVPISHNGAGDLQCIDLDPADGGKVGQIVLYRHDNELRECVAESLTNWLELLANDMETGKFEVRDGELVRR
jgi:cell wall assembly regulator SMI1